MDQSTGIVLVRLRCAAHVVRDGGDGGGVRAKAAKAGAEYS